MSNILFVAIIPIAWLIVALTVAGYDANTDGCSDLDIVTNYILTPITFIALYKVAASKLQAWGLLFAMFMQSGIVHMIKYRTAIVRPNGNLGSFPSGHTASAATLSYYALLLFLPQFRDKVASLILLSFAIAYPWYVGCCRLNTKQHAPSDLAASHVIALVLTTCIAYIVRKDATVLNGASISTSSRVQLKY